MKIEDDNANDLKNAKNLAESATFSALLGLSSVKSLDH